MKLRLFLLVFFYVNVCLGKEPVFTQTKDGVIVYTDSLYTGVSSAIKLEVISDDIVKVIASPRKDIVSTQSLITAYTKSYNLSWNVATLNEKVVLKTRELTVEVNPKTGGVSFLIRMGKKYWQKKTSEAGPSNR